MTNKKDKFELWKAILEVRYPAAPALFDNRGKIVLDCQRREGMTEWAISDNKVVVHNEARTLILNAGHTSAAFIEERPRSPRSFSVQASEYMLEVLKTLEVNKSTRFGLRKFYIAERKGFGGLVKKIGRRFYGLDEDEWEIFGGFPQDVASVFTLKFDEGTVNYRFGPMEKVQYKRDGLIESQETFEKLPEVSLLIDFDLFRLNPSGRGLEDLVRDFCQAGGERIEEHVSKFEQKFGEL